MSSKSVTTGLKRVIHKPLVVLEDQYDKHTAEINKIAILIKNNIQQKCDVTKLSSLKLIFKNDSI